MKPSCSNPCSPRPGCHGAHVGVPCELEGTGSDDVYAESWIYLDHHAETW